MTLRLKQLEQCFTIELFKHCLSLYSKVIADRENLEKISEGALGLYEDVSQYFKAISQINPIETKKKCLKLLKKLKKLYTETGLFTDAKTKDWVFHNLVRSGVYSKIYSKVLSGVSEEYVGELCLEYRRLKPQSDYRLFHHEFSPHLEALKKSLKVAAIAVHHQRQFIPFKVPPRFVEKYKNHADFSDQHQLDSEGLGSLPIPDSFELTHNIVNQNERFAKYLAEALFIRFLLPILMHDERFIHQNNSHNRSCEEILTKRYNELSRLGYDLQECSVLTPDLRKQLFSWLRYAKKRLSKSSLGGRLALNKLNNEYESGLKLMKTLLKHPDRFNIRKLVESHKLSQSFKVFNELWIKLFIHFGVEARQAIKINTKHINTLINKCYSKSLHAMETNYNRIVKMENAIEAMRVDKKCKTEISHEFDSENYPDLFFAEYEKKLKNLRILEDYLAKNKIYMTYGSDLLMALRYTYLYLEEIKISMKQCEQLPEKEITIPIIPRNPEPWWTKAPTELYERYKQVHAAAYKVAKREREFGPVIATYRQYYRQKVQLEALIVKIKASFSKPENKIEILFQSQKLEQLEIWKTLVKEASRVAKSFVDPFPELVADELTLIREKRKTLICEYAQLVERLKLKIDLYTSHVECHQLEAFAKKVKANFPNPENKIETLSQSQRLDQLEIWKTLVAEASRVEASLSDLSPELVTDELTLLREKRATLICEHAQLVERLKLKIDLYTCHVECHQLEAFAKKVKANFPNPENKIETLSQSQILNQLKIWKALVVEASRLMKSLYHPSPELVADELTLLREKRATLISEHTILINKLKIIIVNYEKRIKNYKHHIEQRIIFCDTKVAELIAVLSDQSLVADNSLTSLIRETVNKYTTLLVEYHQLNDTIKSPLGRGNPASELQRIDDCLKELDKHCLDYAKVGLARLKSNKDCSIGSSLRALVVKIFTSLLSFFRSVLKKAPYLESLTVTLFSMSFFGSLDLRHKSYCSSARKSCDY